jgi:N4-gp56 family major capsid protein
MADSNWASGLQVSRWAKQLYYETAKEIYFEKFMGDGSDSMIQAKHDLEGAAGKDVTFGLLTNLSGSGVSGDDSLEGNEEAMSTYSQTVSTAMKRNAVRDTGSFDNSKVLFDFRKEAMSVLKTWLAEKVDSDIFTSLASSPSRTFRADDGSSTVAARSNESSTAGSLTSADSISLADISAMKRLAQVPEGSTELRMRPIRVEGKDHYVLLIHPEVAYDLTQLSEWQQAQREAQSRGSDNPLFSGALGVWDGVVIHAHENISQADTGGGSSNLHYSVNLFMGAQAGLYARSGEPVWVEKTFDYGNQLGVAGGLIYGQAKATFNSEDYAVIAYYTQNTDFTS